MTVLADYSIPRLRLEQNWTRTEIDWSAFNAGGRFTEPDPTLAGDEACWIRPKVEVAQALRIELGPTATRRRAGRLVIQVFVPAGRGEKDLASLCTDLEALFRDYQEGGAVFLEPVSRLVGPSGAWMQANLEVPFRRDEVI